MRIGIVASSGGSAFDSMRQILIHSQPNTFEFLIATDRPCGIEGLARENGLPTRRFETTDNTDFSRQTAQWFASLGGVDMVILYFLRLVTADLFHAYPTFNIHPSLLPAFRGFNPIERASREQVRFMGATAHLVDEKTDGGPIVAQVTMPIAAGESMERLHKYSFVQKVYLSVLLVEMRRQGRFPRDGAGQISVASGLPFTDRCNPRVENANLWESLQRFQAEQGVEVLR
jgi:phosphoribosylglycinamide formyltransferase 1